MSTLPIPLVARAERKSPPPADVRGAETRATRRGQTVVDVLHGRALQHYAGTLRQYLTLRLRSEAAGLRALTRLRVLVASARSEALLAPPGIRARLFRLARGVADDLASEHADPGTLPLVPYFDAPAEHTRAVTALRALPSEDREILELHIVRGLQLSELACVLARPLSDVEARLADARQLAMARLSGLGVGDEPLETLLEYAYTVHLKSGDGAASSAWPRTTRGTEGALSALPAALMGRVIAGRYAIEARVGSGAFGDVYRATDTEVRGHVVALKILHQASPSDDERERALRELRLIASVFHPSIVQFKDHGWHEGRLWFVMPWYEGETLEDRIEREPLTRHEARAIFEPLARALASMHARGIRHQDIKPENIFLTSLPGDSRPLPVLLDLGVAAEDAEMLFAGTPTYFAPEVACQFASVEPKPPVGHAADVFALALALRNALEPSTQGDLPSHTVETFVEARARAVPALPRNPKLRFLDPWFARWLALDAEERPSAAELAEQLSVLTLPEERRARHRRTAAIALPLSLMALLAAGATYLHVQEGERQRATEVHRAQQAAEQLRGNLVDSQANVEQLRGRVEESSFSSQQLQASLAAHSHRLIDSESRVAALTSTVTDLRASGAALTIALEEGRERATALERELLTSQQQLTTLGRRLDERQQELVTQQSALDETRRALRDTRASEGAARASAETSMALLAAERARAETLVSSMVRLQNEQVRLTGERQRAIDALEAAEAELRALRRDAQSRAAARESAPGVTPQTAPPPMPAENPPGA